MIDRACISLNHRCNLRCRYCHFAGKEEGVDNAEYEFSPDEAEKVAENIANYCSLNDIRGFKLGIVGSGEPLLSFPAIVSIVEKVRKVGGGAIKMYTITNGVCLTGEMIDFFYRNRDLIDVNFSLDGNEKVHNCLRQGYKMTFAAITEYEKVFGHKPLINATVTRKTIDNADEVISFFVNNGFDRVNFSIVSDIDDPAVKITQAEYEVFLERCGKSGIKMRQKRGGIDRTYDCAKYGRLCGVGHTNIFITKKAIYPCGRFFGRNEYKLGEFDEKLSNIEAKFTRFEPLADGCCYFDTYSGGKKE